MGDSGLISRFLASSKFIRVEASYPKSLDSPWQWMRGCAVDTKSMMGKYLDTDSTNTFVSLGAALMANILKEKAPPKRMDSLPVSFSKDFVSIPSRFGSYSVAQSTTPRRSLPLPFPTTLCFSHFARNTFFPHIPSLMKRAQQRRRTMRVSTR
eukprot:TRINITY_DN25992_c0_g1_i1.p1 TRINITY_DN25992_c0_g1~~TRINITY_DN25992_c0_g1_i1.p1  ORF type:complete len:166 (-),score=32.90 TRINITY_DN25992_c0_g1_i1:72-530(-)